MSTQHPSITAAEMVSELQRLIDAIDRRVPQLERLAEPGIAQDAADLRERAVELMRSITTVVRTGGEAAPPTPSKKP